MKILDKKLKELRKVFESETSITFTNYDKQSVLKKIQKKRNRHMDHFFPKIITAIFLVLSIFIGGITANDYFHSTNSPIDSEIDVVQVLIKSRELLNQLAEVETSAASYDGKKEIKFRLMVEKKITEAEAASLFNQILDSIINYSNDENIWDDYNGYFDINSYDEDIVYKATKLINEDLVVNNLVGGNPLNITFDPEMVQTGDVLGEFEITDIQKHKDETLITFQGNNLLSGDINYYEKLEFTPDSWLLSELPIADQHMEEEINFYFNNSEMINKEELTPKIPQNINIDITGFQYLYSPVLGSSINFEVREYLDVKYETEETTEVHRTTIELSDELLELYSQYEFSLDDLLLKDLNPIDVFKLYHHANQIKKLFLMIYPPWMMK